nr:MAG TPA: hypothetical protein [Caudoviricetes sp.]
MHPSICLKYSLDTLRRILQIRTSGLNAMRIVILLPKMRCAV